MYIKFCRFAFSICTNLALNVFFFSDETMHKIFLDYWKYNFVQQIPQIIYSTLVSQMIELIVCYLSLSDKHYYQIKKLNIKSLNKILRIVKCIQLKFYFFFVFTGIMLFFLFNHLLLCNISKYTKCLYKRFIFNLCFRTFISFYFVFNSFFS